MPADRPMARGSCCWALVVGLAAVLLLWARAPFAPRNFWGEDGTRFFAHAMADGWIRPLGRSLAGYFHFLPRLLGAVGTLVPLEWAPAAVFVGCLASVGWFAATIWLAGDRLLPNPFVRSAVAVSPVLLPIVGFESIGNITNLHFLMLAPAAVVIMGTQEGRGRQVNDVLLVTMAGLTSPTTLGLAPLAVARLASDRRDGSRRPAPVLVAWLVGVTAQFMMIATMVDDSREMATDRSVPEIGFLFLERVLLYNLVPFWPRIAGDGFETVTVALVLRGLVGLVLMGGLLFAVVAMLRRLPRVGEGRRVLSIVSVPLTGGIFFFGGAWLIAPEPRYAVFPAFCALWTIGLVSAEWTVRWRVVVGSVLLLVVITHWIPSDLRRTGPTWSDGLEAAADDCRLDPDGFSEVPALPEGWTVAVDCDRVLDR